MNIFKAVQNEQGHARQPRQKQHVIYAQTQLQDAMFVQYDDDQVQRADQDTEYHDGILPADIRGSACFGQVKTRKVKGEYIARFIDQFRNRNKKHGNKKA